MRTQNGAAAPAKFWKATGVTLLPLALLAGFLLILAQKPAPVVVESVAPTAVNAAQQIPAPPSAPQPVSQQADPPLAVVNDRPIEKEALAAAQAIDRAMARLLGTSAANDPSTVLERLVNTLLVEQAATEAGFVVAAEQSGAALAQFLQANGVTAPALESALADEGVSGAAFQTTFTQLLLVDQFTREQAAAQGLASADYLRLLQQGARISFGPDVAALSPPESAPADAAAPVAVATTATEASIPTATPANDSGWQLLPFVADPAFSAPSPPAAPATDNTATASVGSVEQTVFGTAAGNYAPDFALPLATDADSQLQLSDLIGQPTLLSFWTTWCPYCLRQTPLLVEAYNRYAEKGIQFVGIDVAEGREQVLPYLETHAIRYPIALDADGRIAEAYAVRGFPTTYFLDAAGRVVARHVGQLSSEQIDEYVTRLINQ